MHVCTIIAKNYVAYARVLARSFADHHPDGRVSVLVVDDFEGYVDPRNEPFELMTPADIGCPEFERMAARYDVLELSTAVKPWLLAHLLAAGANPITYLDPDICVYAPLHLLDELGRERGLVLIPHTTVPIPFDGERPSQIDIMIAGIFNLGYITISAGAQAKELLGWWSDRLRRDCLVDPVYGYFVDQRWMDLIPGLVSDYAVVRDPEYNVAYWNLHARHVQQNGARYTVDGRPLSFFHFSGFDPDRPAMLSRYQSRIDMAERPALARLCAEYAQAVLTAGHQVARRWPYSFDVLPDGTRFVKPLRRLFRAGEERAALTNSPFDNAGCEAFLTWAADPDDDVPGVSRLLAELYNERPDLQRAFPDLAGDDRTRYLNWARETGLPELGLSKRFAPPSGTMPKLTQPRPRSELAAQPPSLIEAPFGVNVVGSYRSERAGGEIARQLVDALDAAGTPLLPVQGRAAPRNRQGHPFSHLGVEHARYPINVICMNPDALLEFAAEAGEPFFAGRYSIALWSWDVLSLPPGGWDEQFELLDEVWVPSQHVARALSGASQVPVIRVPLPVEVPRAVPMSRAALGIPADQFVFLFTFDHVSGFDRNNPLGVVEAFTRAFEPNSGASLVIKSINGAEDPSNSARLRAAVAHRADIRLLEHDTTFVEERSLIATCDCFVSLHRAEAFGLPMAEAMYLEKPVIATGYSGNLDFMTPQNSYLVDWARTPMGPDAPPYAAEVDWVEPSIDHAVALMRAVFGDRDEARERGRHGANQIRQSHSRVRAGEAMLARLREARRTGIEEGRAGFVEELPTPASLALQVERAGSPAKTLRGVREVLRRTILRIMRPFTSYQFSLDAQVLRHLALAARDAIQAESDRLRQERKLAEERQVLGAQLDDLLELSQPIADRLDEMSERLARSEAETRAIPYMEGVPFATRSDPMAGIVFGYDASNGAVEAARYRAFEDIFRGSEDFIRDRQRRYLPIIGRREPVFDFGCGRGELLDLLREEGVASIGVDTDPGMVARCHEKGHADVVEADGIEHLRHFPDQSLGVVFAAQVIEHLGHEQLEEFFLLARRKLKPAGLLIAETVNPHSPAALKTFWVDLTHQQPIFPEVALELVREAGFPSAYVFHPNGTGDAEHDRFVEGEYAVVARSCAAAP